MTRRDLFCISSGFTTSQFNQRYEVRTLFLRVCVRLLLWHHWRTFWCGENWSDLTWEAQLTHALLQRRYQAANRLLNEARPPRRQQYYQSYRRVQYRSSICYHCIGAGTGRVPKDSAEGCKSAVCRLCLKYPLIMIWPPHPSPSLPIPPNPSPAGSLPRWSDCFHVMVPYTFVVACPAWESRSDQRGSGSRSEDLGLCTRDSPQKSTLSTLDLRTLLRQASQSRHGQWASFLRDAKPQNERIQEVRPRSRESRKSVQFANQTTCYECLR